MHLIKHKNDEQFKPRFLTFPLCNKLHMHMPEQVESHLRDFGALILCTSGLFGMFLLMFE